MKRTSKKLLIALALIEVGFCYGVVSQQFEWVSFRVPDSVSGDRLWRLVHKEPAGAALAERIASRERRLASLSQLGYLSGYKPPPPKVGVLIHHPERAHGGYNFYLSADSPGAFLMDMEGNDRHAWSHPFQNDWPALRPGEKLCQHEQHTGFWRRAHLFPNGDVLAIFEGSALIKLDRNSNLLWAYRGGFHHDLDVADDGRIYVLTRRDRSHHPAVVQRAPLVEDLIAVLSPEGELLERVSLLDAIAHSQYRDFLFARVPPEADILHTNTLELLHGRLESESNAFRKGNVLISFRNVDVIAVVDLAQQKVVWALAGMWKMQHDPTILDNGNMLVFDNQGGRDGYSKVLEFDPFTQAVAWAYEGNEANEFFSEFCGSNQRLPNGNTLITDSLSGRALETTPAGEPAWQWVNPRRTGPGDELIATVYEMLRIECDFVQNWLASDRVSESETRARYPASQSASISN